MLHDPEARSSRMLYMYLVFSFKHISIEVFSYIYMHVNTSVIFDLIRSSDVDECFDSPCGESVPCVNVEGSYSCECLDGWTGKNCTEGRTILIPVLKKFDALWLIQKHYGYFLNQNLTRRNWCFRMSTKF